MIDFTSVATPPLLFRAANFRPSLSAYGIRTWRGLDRAISAMILISVYTVLFEEPSHLVKVVSPFTTSQEILMGDDLF